MNDKLHNLHKLKKSHNRKLLFKEVAKIINHEFVYTGYELDGDMLEQLFIAMKDLLTGDTDHA